MLESSMNDLFFIFCNFEFWRQIEEMGVGLIQFVQIQKLLNCLTDPYLTESNYLSSVYRYTKLIGFHK